MTPSHTKFYKDRKNAKWMGVCVLDADAGRVGGDLPPAGILGGHDPLDRLQPVVETAGHIVHLVEQLFILGGERRRTLPLRHIVEDQPGQADEERDDGETAHHDSHDFLFHGDQPSFFALVSRAAFIASSSASTFSELRSSAISSSRLLGGAPRLRASAWPSA